MKQFLLTHPVWDVTIRDSGISQTVRISTHTSRVGCDPERAGSMGDSGKFLLTHPVWDVTVVSFNTQYKQLISTHTSRVGCDANICNMAIMKKISTHTSRVGCDNAWRTLIYFQILFLLTHPVWDVTFSSLLKSFHQFNFYSHIPCGM